LAPSAERAAGETRSAVNILSAGQGSERYTLRFPIDFAHNAKLDDSLSNIDREIVLFGRSVSISAAPFGALVVARDFATEAHAVDFADRLRLATQVLSVQRQIPIFTEMEPVPIIDVVNATVGEGIEERRIDGTAFQTTYTIVPEHQTILSEGELRGNLVRLVAIDYFLDACTLVNGCDIPANSPVSAAIHTAGMFWSLSCTHASEIVTIVNVVAALEVLSTMVTSRLNREQAVRSLLRHFEGRLSPPDNPYRFALGRDVASFCKALFRRRNELIHRGKSPGTDAEVTHAASTLCRKVLLLAIADHYCSRSPSDILLVSTSL
jgi:hypothetical protein